MGIWRVWTKAVGGCSIPLAYLSADLIDNYSSDCGNVSCFLRRRQQSNIVHWPRLCLEAGRLICHRYFEALSPFRQRLPAIFLFLVLFCFGTTFCCAQDEPTLAKFTAAHTRVVWLQDHSSTANDVLATGKQLRLMKFDSQDGQGETALLNELRNYSKPLLAPDGQRVVYSDQFSQKFLVINWDGTGRKVLGDGYAIDVCRDLQDGTEWVYVAKRVGKPDVAVYRNVRRVKLDDPKVTQKVWDQTDVSCDNFQLSADGLRAGGDFPWPHGGIADLAKKTWKKLDQGCWPSIAPDNSGLNWVLDGPHRHLQFHRPDQAEGWKVDVSTAANVKGAEIFYPRWSNHVRYLALSGPFQIQGPVNLISGGGAEIEINIGRFSADYHSIEAWYQLTHNQFADFYPDVWIEKGEASTIELPGLKNPSLAIQSEWPGVTKSLAFAWSNGSVANQLVEGSERPGHSCKVTPHGAAVFGRFFDLRLNGGFFTLDDLLQSLASSVQGTTALTLQMLITPTSQPVSAAVFCEFGTAEHPALQLSQLGTQLEWKRGSDRGQLEVPAWKTQTDGTIKTIHLGVIVMPRQLEFFFDGKPARTFPLQMQTAPAKWNEVRLGSANWRGEIEAIAIHSRNLSANEMLQEANHSRVRLATRKPIPRLRLEVKCLEPSAIPKPEQILPYRRALALDVCEVVKVENLTTETPKAGNRKPDLAIKVGDKILVARWVILDGSPLPAAVFKSGATAKFNLERFGDHRELESERQIIDTADIDLPMWYTLD
jgi:hypothetical protein